MTLKQLLRQSPNNKYSVKADDKRLDALRIEKRELNKNGWIIHETIDTGKKHSINAGKWVVFVAEVEGA